jgi:hypothetical protein
MQHRGNASLTQLSSSSDSLAANRFKTLPPHRAGSSTIGSDPNDRQNLPVGRDGSLD